jgi:glycosyltransferase involved in cell wall biosynthesis
MAARLLSTKGVREYAAAAERLRVAGNAAPCRLAGWIDRTPAAIGQRELDRWCARGAIEFLGRLEDVRPAIAAASVCVLPSHREGLPLFLLEAMAMGRAVIATAVPGCREAVDPGVTGLLVPPREPAALGEAMATLAADPARVAAMGAAGRRRVLERFESRAVCIRLLAAIGLGGTASTIAPPCDP